MDNKKSLKLTYENFAPYPCTIEKNDDGPLTIWATLEPGKIFYFPTPFASDSYIVSPKDFYRFWVIEKKTPTHIVIQSDTSAPLGMKFVGHWK